NVVRARIAVASVLNGDIVDAGLEAPHFEDPGLTIRQPRLMRSATAAARQDRYRELGGERARLCSRHETKVAPPLEPDIVERGRLALAHFRLAADRGRRGERHARRQAIFDSIFTRIEVVDDEAPLGVRAGVGILAKSGHGLPAAGGRFAARDEMSV